MKPAVARSYHNVERKSLMDRMVRILANEKISIKSEDLRNGLISTDSFDVTPDLCDCGKNILGAEYPGQRRGVIFIKINDRKETVVTVDLKTRLRIRANNKIVLCASRGVFEEKLLTALEKELGETTVHQRD
jgi:hypothetical protein